MRTTTGAQAIIRIALVGAMLLQSTAFAANPYVYRIPLQGVDAIAEGGQTPQPPEAPDFDNPGSIKEFPVNALVGDNVSLTISTQNGQAPITWSQAAMPPGITQSGASVSGQPQAAGTSSVDVTAQDALGRTATARLNFSFTAPFLQITQAKPELRVGEAFAMAIASNVPGGTYSASGAPRMTLAQNANGATVSGTATQAGTWAVTASVGKPGTSVSASGSSSVTVHGQLQLTLSPQQAPTAPGPVSITANVANAIGSTSIALTSDAAALSARGLSFNGTAISGTLSAGEATSVTLRATDAFDGAVADASLVIPAIGGQAASITAAPLRAGDTVVAGNQVTIASDVPSPACTTTQNVPGLTVAPDCSVSGQVISAGEYALAVAIRPSSNPSAQPVNASGTVSVSPALTLQAVNPGPALLVGQSVTQSTTASGVVATASYSLANTTAQALAAIGMTFDAGTGSVSGTPSENVNLSYQIVVTDSHDGRTATAAFTLQTGAASITLSGVPNPNVRGGESKTYTAASNIQNAVFSLSGNPPHVTIDPATGVVTTTSPANQVTHDAIAPYTITATSPTNPALTKSTLNNSPGTIRPALTIALGSQSLRADVQATIAPTITGAQAPQALIVSPSLPPGLSVSGQTITGKPTTPGTYAISVTVQDADGTQKNTAVTITVTDALGVTYTSPNSPLGRGAVGTAMSITAAPVNNLSAVTFAAVTTTARPQSLSGLGLAISSSGAITGTPTMAFTGDVNIRMTEVHAGQTNVIDAALPLVITAPATAATMIPVVTYQGADRTTTLYDNNSNTTSIATSNFTNTVVRFTFSEPVTINGVFAKQYTTCYGYFTNGNLSNVTTGESRNLNGTYTASGRQFGFTNTTGTVFEFNIGSSCGSLTTTTFKLTYNSVAPTAP